MRSGVSMFGYAKVHFPLFIPVKSMIAYKFCLPGGHRAVSEPIRLPFPSVSRVVMSGEAKVFNLRDCPWTTVFFRSLPSHTTQRPFRLLIAFISALFYPEDITMVAIILPDNYG